MAAPDGPADNAVTPDGAGDLFTPLVTLAALLFVAATIGIALFALKGGPFVDALSAQVGEVGARRAQRLEQIGQYEEAVIEYQRALWARFDSKMQHTLTLRRFGQMLLDMGQVSESIAVLQECVQTDPRDLRAQYLLCRALSEDGQFAEAAAQADRWYTEATRQGDDASRAEALYHCGRAYEALEKPDKAFKAYTEGRSIRPESANSFQVAVMLHEKGRIHEAILTMQDFIEKGSGKRLKEAEALRQEWLRQP